MKSRWALWSVFVIVGIVVVVALAASFTHMHDWTLHVLPKGTNDLYGWVNAVISELTPLAGSLYLMYAHQNSLRKWPAWVMLGYGLSASVIGQIHAAGSDPSILALVAALLPVTAAFVLIKVGFMLLEAQTQPQDAPEVPAPVRVPGSVPPSITDVPEIVPSLPQIEAQPVPVSVPVLEASTEPVPVLESVLEPVPASPPRLKLVPPTKTSSVPVLDDKIQADAEALIKKYGRNNLPASEKARVEMKWGKTRVLAALRAAKQAS